ncbi:MAG: cytochrome c oxidase subunit 3 [Bacteroidota bacterium]
MENVMQFSDQKKKIHPYKFTLWVAMGSIIMMFAGFTSAYIVKRNQVNWQGFDLPMVFWYSTAVIVISSISMQAALRNFKQRRFAAYRQLIVLTALLGTAFIAMQFMGFAALNNNGIKLIGQGSNVAGSFLAVIAGMHLLHVLGGIIAIIIMLVRATRKHTRNYNTVPVEVLNTYWHFVDGLWIYLFVFLSMVN